MRWNKVFWISLVMTEAVLLLFLSMEFTTEVLIAGALVFLLGFWKLAEDIELDLERKRPRPVRVSRALLKKLKQPG